MSIFCRRKAIYIGVGALLFGAGAVLYLFDPLKASFFPACPFHLLTGYHCSGCGSLRALHRLFHGNISGAMAMNPLMVISLPFIGLLFLRSAWLYKKWLPWACMATLILYGIIRNIPVRPFLMLAPH